MIKISKIAIKNYRSCSYTEFEPHKDLSVLIGPNGSGKTTVLRAIKLLSSLKSIRNSRAGGDEPIVSASGLKIWYDWNGKTIIYTVILDIVTNEHNEDEILDLNESWQMYDVIGSKKKIKIPIEALSYLVEDEKYSSNRMSFLHGLLYPNYFEKYKLNEEAILALKEIAHFISGINYYSASQFTNPSSCPIFFEVDSTIREERGISIIGHKKLLYDLYKEFNENLNSFKEYLEIVGLEGINLVEDISFEKIKTSSFSYSVMTGGHVKEKERINWLVIPSFIISGNKLSPSQLSEGTFKTLALIFYLVTDNSSLLMIEEPEVCVHYGLLKSVIELIKAYSDNKQTILSTHSDFLLDSIEFDSVFAVKKSKEGTKVSRITKQLKKKEILAIKDYLKNEGGLGEYWKHGDLEGE